MKMALDGAAGANMIKSYEPGRVEIRGRFFTRSLVVLPDSVIADWQPRDTTQLRPAHLGIIADHGPEVVILGTGETQRFPDPGLFVALMEAGVGFEIMDNAAACRTYNILLAEGRRVAAALLIEGGD